MTNPDRDGERRTRRAMRALANAQLIAAMREGIPEAWAEFDARYQPLLEAFARRIGIADGDSGECITETLDDAKLRFTAHAQSLPSSIGGYLVRALRFRFMRLQRSARRRARHYGEAADASDSGSRVVQGVLSEDTLRAARGPMLVAEGRSDTEDALARFASLLSARLTADERRMLAWVGDLVPRRDIAAWLGIEYEAARKRIQRLGKRLQALAPESLRRLTPEERRAVERILTRAGALRRVESGRATHDSGEEHDDV